MSRFDERENAEGHEPLPRVPLLRQGALRT